MGIVKIPLGLSLNYYHCRLGIYGSLITSFLGLCYSLFLKIVELSTFNDYLGLAQVTALSLLVSEVAAH